MKTAIKPADAYNATLTSYWRQYLVFLIKSELDWQKRMEQAGNEAQAIIFEHSDADGKIARRQELNRRLKMLSQSLAMDLQTHLRSNITTAAMLSAKGTSEAHKAFFALARSGNAQGGDNH